MSIPAAEPRIPIAEQRKVEATKDSRKSEKSKVENSHFEVPFLRESFELIVRDWIGSKARFTPSESAGVISFPWRQAVETNSIAEKLDKS